ncbi:membrane protein insertase [Mizugakiibacter sediminis]|uniref:Membrane protein insertase YidC n=1 Tax=Mizugakiibacter sediminis TaxID=1475481 RepID=A0A0K8QIW1_9GAMM|nr:membrane protein insertase YidC [Mizugakiibacter sediminis]GAP64778.1 membrane protein insertase [Mizugakiibacter sediminis]
MNQTRSLLVFALLFIAYLIWNQWQVDYRTPPATASAPAAGSTAAAAVPAASGAAAATPAPLAPAAASAGTPAEAHALVTVTTDVLRLAIDTQGGSLVRADLLHYPVKPEDTQHPVRLFDDSAERYFVAQSGLVSANAPAPDHRAVFKAEQSSYTLAPGQQQLVVTLTWQDPSGLTVKKRYTFERGSYVIRLAQEIDNGSAQPWSGNAYRQLVRVPPPAPPKHFLEFYDPERVAYKGAAWYGPEKKFQKLPFDKFASEPLDAEVTGGWVAMLQHYFFAAWIPDAGERSRFGSAELDEQGTQRYLVRALGPTLTVAPGGSAVSQARLYVGPELQSSLDSVAPGLSLVVDYGVFTVIAQPLHWILAHLHQLVQNWGLAIILLVLLIKAAFFKLSEAQFKAGAKMRKLSPRIQALKERYGEDKQKMQQAMMELYQKEKVNPLAGCLPTLVQIPVFFALYYVLMFSVELRQAPFFGWIQDLSAPDPYFVLPVLYTLVMIATQYLTPTVGMDPTQAKIMKVMPIVFAVMFAFFPAGLTLYYVVNGLTSVIQQWFITRRIEAGDKARA